MAKQVTTTPATPATPATPTARTKGNYVIVARDEANGAVYVGYGKDWETRKVASAQVYKVRENAQRWINGEKQQARGYAQTARIIEAQEIGR